MLAWPTNLLLVESLLQLPHLVAVAVLPALWHLLVLQRGLGHRLKLNGHIGDGDGHAARTLTSVRPRLPHLLLLLGNTTLTNECDGGSISVRIRSLLKCSRAVMLLARCGLGWHDGDG